MNSRERVLKALACEEPDQVPVAEIYINDQIIIDLCRILFSEPINFKVSEENYKANENVLELLCNVIEKLEIDATFSNISIGIKNITEQIIKDKFGVLYKVSMHGEPIPFSGPIKTLSDLKDFNMKNKLKISDFDSLKYVVKKLGNKKAHFINIVDPFKISWRCRGGMQNLLIDYIANPALLLKLTQATTEYCLSTIDIAADLGADVIVLQGDLAGGKTTLMSPEHYRKYLKTYHDQIVEYTHKKGLKILKHSDGNIWGILDDLSEIGFDGIHPVQPQCMDIQEVKNHLGNKLCIMGNIDCQNLLPFGNKYEIEKTVRETIKKVAYGGGYIISSSNTIHPGVKPENYLTMVTAAKKYGKYNKN